VPAFLATGATRNLNQPSEASDARNLALPFERRWQIPETAAKAWRTPVRPEERSFGCKEGEAFFKDRYGFVANDALAWRRIDDDWLSEAENLALQLDSLTNNSSLALAIEVGNARRVILMAADAQVGNWLSWHDGTWQARPNGGASESVSAEDLLGRTVLYKVGHHGSHNATLKQKGLEMMNSDELVAMIPVDQKFANNTKGWQMPFPNLLTELTRRTKGRVIRADGGVPAKAAVDAGVRKKFFDAANETALYTEYMVTM
jgi:hypothetical protein